MLGKVGTTEVFPAELCTMGVPRDPWDFLQRAIEVGHPRSLAIHLNDEVTSMLQQNFSGDLHLLVKERAAFLMKWTKRCKELESAERDLHNNMEPHLQQVLHGKRLLVFQEMLNELGYPDDTLVQDICKGFPLSGWLPKSKVFPPAFKRPEHDMDTAKKTAKGVNHGICKQVAEPGDEALNEEVWKQTEEEVAKGWTWFDNACDVKSKLLAKRFGLQQGEKVRLIDDCTIGGFNATCGSSERLRVHSVDEMSAYIAWCLTHLPGEAMEKVVGKTYDLKNAYKQYGIASSDRDLLRLAVWNPRDKEVNFLGANALPFGAIGSVSAFLRVSMAVWYLGVRGLRLCWTSFFDDYTLLSKGLAANSAAIAAESLFDMLGIQFARDGKKAVGWDTKVRTLGVQFDLKPEGQKGVVLLGHTENRVQELKTALESFLTCGVMTSKDAERLRGRLQWFESFAGGRIAQQALRTISSLVSDSRVQRSLRNPEINAIKFLRDRVLSAPPTCIKATNLQTWLVFSDGACEGETDKEGTIGAILVSPDGKLCSYFSERVPTELMQKLMLESAHPIFELELLPVWCAMKEWGRLMRHSQCVYYLDNEAARGALTNGATSTEYGRRMVQGFVIDEMEHQIKTWYARVPTSSNLADKPSRLETGDLDALGVSRVAIDWQTVNTLLDSTGSDGWGFKNGILVHSPALL